MSIDTTLSKIQVGYFVKFILLLALATGGPLIGIHSQWITGPIVNATLILAVFLVGLRGAVLIGLLPSTIALGIGLLPAVLAPMVPFIIISNVILVLVVSLIVYPERAERVEGSRRYVIPGLTRNPEEPFMDSRFRGNDIEGRESFTHYSLLITRYFFGLLLAAGLKFLFLFLTSGIVIKLLLNQKLAPAVAQMMSWPQFFTALIGGVLAFGILKILKK